MPRRPAGTDRQTQEPAALTAARTRLAEYFKSEVMELCHNAGLYQIDLLNGSANRITESDGIGRGKGQLANLTGKTKKTAGEPRAADTHKA